MHNALLGQVLRNYFWGTQGRPNVCFDGFNTDGEPNVLSLLWELSPLEHKGYVLLLQEP